MPKVENLEFEILSDNVVDRNGLIGLPGFSVLVSAYLTNGELVQIVFDTTSNPEELKKNIDYLDVDLSQVQHVILSHGHWDHVAGLGLISELITKKVPLICHPHALLPKLRSKNGKEQDIGIREYFTIGEIEEMYSVMTTRKPFKITDSILTTGEIPLETTYEKKVGRLKDIMTVIDEKRVRDEILDDLSLIFIMSDETLVILTGCCHAGLVNTINQAMRITGISVVKFVIGGFHLSGASEERLQKTCEKLRAVRISGVAPAHCTGIKGKCKLLSEFKKEYKEVRVGTKFSIS
ncbi:MAG: 7, 8-dihydropterin-6-methyl-4-(Beta-D-ribofuranosyl)-aminobenzene-5'-phosphate synthase [Candidatus Thorarchaeota archaeon]|nr:MAG: 7, 8-dihydropterin-6-methyl-4-(Beta-D-ribofuranosyl)-aminobenzene-5'-phosphate synthase [Candidatus Thorarchaeota archaeon]